MTPIDAAIDCLRDLLDADPNVLFAYVSGSSVRFPERCLWGVRLLTAHSMDEVITGE